MIHKYRMNGYNIVIDVGSGSVHIVDDAVYDILTVSDGDGEDAVIPKLSPIYGMEKIRECLDEIATLRSEGLLFASEDYEAVLPSIQSHTPVVKALCLHVAHDCNLKCRYCFASEGEYHGERALMSFEVGKAAIDFMLANSGNRRNLEIDFFGGEPLMNLDVVKQIVSYARSVEKAHNKNFRFTITTNGVLLDEPAIEYINENMHNVVLSLDGRKAVHDKMRPRAGGQGSYDKILPAFLRLADGREQKNYFVRGTFTRENLDFAEDVLHLAELGFSQVSVEPVVAEASEDYSLREEDLPTLFAEYERLAVDMLAMEKEDKRFNFFHFFIDLEGGPCVAKRVTGCGAGTEYLAVTPEGDLYPCHQFVGSNGFKMGDVFTGVSNADMRTQFAGCNVYTKEECRSCWAKFYCSGGCAANAYNLNGDINKPYGIGCELQRKRCECAIMMKAATADTVSAVDSIAREYKYN